MAWGNGSSASYALCRSSWCWWRTEKPPFFCSHCMLSLWWGKGQMLYIIRTLKCIFLSKRLRETRTGGQRQPGDGIHATSYSEICITECTYRNSHEVTSGRLPVDLLQGEPVSPPLDPRGGVAFGDALQGHRRPRLHRLLRELEEQHGQSV